MLGLLERRIREHQPFLALLGEVNRDLRVAPLAGHRDHHAPAPALVEDFLADTDGDRGPAITVSVGEEVFHERWGRGVVIAVAGQGSNAEVTVHFAEEGQKRLVLAYAPLKKT